MVKTNAREWAFFSVQMLGQMSVMAGALGFSLLALGRIEVSIARPLLVFVVGLALLAAVGIMRKRYLEVSKNAILCGLSGCLMAGATHVLATGSVWSIAAMLIASLIVGFIGINFSSRQKRAAKTAKAR